MSSRDPWWLPNPATLLAIALGGILLTITIAKGFQDPDYFWHVTTGELIVRSGSVPSVDPFSFTWGGRPWTPHEWLSEVLMYLLVGALGQVGTLFVFGLFPAAIIAVFIFALARRGLSIVAIAAPCAVAGWVLVPYVTLRPQAISWFLMAVLMVGLWSLRREQAWRALLLVPFFILWANLHGLYVVGLGVVGLYVVFTLAGRTPMSGASRWMIAAFVGCLLAAMATPAGPAGILYPLRYVDSGDWGLANIQEWQSPSFHEPAHLAFLALILLVALNGARATPGWLAVLSYLGIAVGLLALRNVPLAAVWSVPTLALGLEDRLRARRAGRPTRAPKPGQRIPRRIMETAVAGLVVVAAALIVLPRSPAAGIDANIARRFPVDGVDYLLRTDPDVRVLAEYGWAGYVINRLYPEGGRVFIDGRNDMYDQAILEDYDAIRDADPGWEALVSEYGVEAILLPPQRTVTRGPAELAGWCEAYRDDREVLLLPCEGA